MPQSFFQKEVSKILLVTLLAFILVFALFLNMQSIQNKAKHSDFTRTYLEYPSKPKKAFKYNGEGGLKYHKGNLLIQDFGKEQIIAFDTRGKILNRYYEELPESVESVVIAWNVDNKGIYMADARRHLIIHLGLNNEKIYQYNPGSMIARATKLNGDWFIINTPKSSDLSMVKVNVKKDSVVQMDFPLPKVEHSTMKYSGFYLQNFTDKTFYVCYMTGKFFCINTDDGKFNYWAETIDRTPFPKVLKQGSKLTYDPLYPVVNKSAGADDQYLYILTRIPALGENLSNSSIIDAYNIENGKYAWSLKVKNFKGKIVRMMTVGPDRFYFSQGEFITYLNKPKITHLQ